MMVPLDLPQLSTKKQSQIHPKISNPNLLMPQQNTLQLRPHLSSTSQALKPQSTIQDF